MYFSVNIHASLDKVEIFFLGWRIACFKLILIHKKIGRLTQLNNALTKNSGMSNMLDIVMVF
jgi:hypothetical protein